MSILDMSIHDAVDIILVLFERFLESAQSLQPPNSTRYDSVQTLFGRFQSWVSCVGAVEPPKASLDAQLVDRRDFSSKILHLLDMIQRNVLFGNGLFFFL